MKLHLSKSLRAALVACVCVAGQTMADDYNWSTTMPDGKVSGTTYNDHCIRIDSDQAVFDVDSETTIGSIGKLESYTGTANLTKTGEGTLTIRLYNEWGGGKQLDSLTVEQGKLVYNGSPLNVDAAGTVTVKNAGSELQLGNITSSVAVGVSDGGKVTVSNTTLNNLTLSGGTLNVAAQQSAYGNVTVSGTNNVISANGYSALRGDVLAATVTDADETVSLVQGDLTLDGNRTTAGEGLPDYGLHVYNTINNHGEVTAQNRVVMRDGSSFGENVTAVNVAENSILDLSQANILTLNSADLDLANGSKIVMGNSPLTVSGSLTLGENVTIDLSGRGLTADTFDYKTMPLFAEVTSFIAAAPVTFDFGNGNTAEYTLALKDGNVRAIPEPTTATLSLLALAGLAARRRRK